MSPDLRVAAVLSMMASACASSPQIGSEPPRFVCGMDSSGWILSEAPKNADHYRRLAAENRHVATKKISASEWGHYDEETWLTKPSGEVILCLADGPPWEAWATDFWIFDAADEGTSQLKIVDQGATITVG